MNTIRISSPQGFTLIELLIVLILISILSSLAYPSYRHYLTQARRSEGQTALVELANRLEQYYAIHQTYQTATIGTTSATDILSQRITRHGWYSLSIPLQTDTAYRLQAHALGPQAKNDSACPNLIFTSEGKKLPNGPGKSCWP